MPVQSYFMEPMFGWAIPIDTELSTGKFTIKEFELFELAISNFPAIFEEHRVPKTVVAGLLSFVV